MHKQISATYPVPGQSHICLRLCVFLSLICFKSLRAFAQGIPGIFMHNSGVPEGPCRTRPVSTARGVARQAASPKVSQYTQISTEYDRAKLPPYNRSDPTSDLESEKTLCFQTNQNKHQERCARGALKVRHGTTSINFHRAVPRSSSHTGPRPKEPSILKVLRCSNP